MPVCLICVDDFGARAAARFQWIAKDIGKYGILEEVGVLWAGLEERPTRKNFWDDDTPEWSIEQAEKEPLLAIRGIEASSDNTEKDRQEIANKVHRIALDEKEKAGAGIRWISDEFLNDFIPPDGSKPLLIAFLGTLANPSTCPVLGGLLSALTQLREEGSTHVATIEYLVVATGAATYSSLPPEISRAWAARSLYDMESYFSGSAGDTRAALCAVIGEERQNRTLTLSDQIDVAAAVLLGITTQGGSDISEDFYQPLKLARLENGRVSYARKGEYFDGEKPFVTVGGAFLIAPKETLASFEAARIASAIARLFARSDPDSERSDDRVHTNDFMAHYVDVIDRAGATYLLDNQASSRINTPFWYYTNIRNNAEYLVSKRWDWFWELLGEDRLLRLPIDDWEAAIHEFERMAEKSFIAWRERDLEELEIVTLEALDSGFEEALKTIGEEAFEEPISFRPRAVAKELILGVKDRVNKSIRDFMKEDVRRTKLEQKEIAVLKQRADKKKENLIAILKEVPSPVAIWFRGIIWAASISLIMLGLPFSMWFINPPWIRIGIGIVLGLLITANMYRNYSRLKARLLSMFSQWTTNYKEWQDQLREASIRDCVGETLQKLDGYCEWLLDPSIDSSYFLAREQSRMIMAYWDDSEIQVLPPSIRRRFLQYFERDMSTAAKKWEDISWRIVKRYSDSLVFRQFPVSIREHFQEIDKLFNLEIDKECSLSKELAHSILQDVRRKIEAGTANEWIPFLSMGHGVLKWALDVIPPTENELLDAEKRRNNRAYTYYELLRDSLKSAVVTLPQCINKSENKESVQLPPEHEAVQYLKVNADIPFKGTKAGRCDNPIVIGMKTGDIFLTPLDYYPTFEINNCISGILNVSASLSADDIIFGDDKDAPRTLIGKSYRIHGKQMQAIKFGYGEEYGG